MAVAFGAIGATVTADSDPAVPYPTGVQAGNLLILYVSNKRPGGSEHPTRPDGWTESDTLSASEGTSGVEDEGEVLCTAYTKTATGSESGSLTVTCGAETQAVMERWTSTLGGTLSVTTVAKAGGCDPGGSTSFGIPNGGNAGPFMTLADGDVIAVAIGVNTDAYSFSSHALEMTGAVFGSISERADFGMTNGTDGRLVVIDAPVTTGATNQRISYTATASASQAATTAASGIFLGIHETAPPPPPPATTAGGRIALGLGM